MPDCRGRQADARPCTVDVKPQDQARPVSARMIRQFRRPAAGLFSSQARCFRPRLGMKATLTGLSAAFPFQAWNGADAVGSAVDKPSGVSWCFPVVFPSQVWNESDADGPPSGVSLPDLERCRCCWDGSSADKPSGVSQWCFRSKARWSQTLLEWKRRCRNGNDAIETEATFRHENGPVRRPLPGHFRSAPRPLPASFRLLLVPRSARFQPFTPASDPLPPCQIARFRFALALASAYTRPARITCHITLVLSRLRMTQSLRRITGLRSTSPSTSEGTRNSASLPIATQYSMP